MKKKVLAIMLVTVSIMLISACGKKEKLYEIPNLSQYKTDYVGDSSKVINIASTFFFIETPPESFIQHFSI